MNTLALSRKITVYSNSLTLRTGWLRIGIKQCGRGTNQWIDILSLTNQLRIATPDFLEFMSPEVKSEKIEQLIVFLDSIADIATAIREENVDQGLAAITTMEEAWKSFSAGLISCS